MTCKYCGSENLAVIIKRPHIKLVCKDCLKFQKFLSKKDFEVLSKVQGIGIHREE